MADTNTKRDEAAERVRVRGHQQPVNAGLTISKPTRREILKLAAVMGLSHLLKGCTMADNKKDQMSTLSSALVIPDSLLAKEATDILREYSTDLLFNHSMRVYLFAGEQGRQQKLRFDPELLYVAATFHDLGLTKKFSSQTNASRSIAPTPSASSSPPITSLKSRYKLPGKPLLCTPRPASPSTCAPK
jgi:HD domain